MALEKERKTENFAAKLRRFFGSKNLPLYEQSRQENTDKKNSSDIFPITFKSEKNNRPSKRAIPHKPLTFYNTLSKSKELFEPIHDGRVGMYNCGPTVYNYVHIGNLRPYVFADILRRTLEWNGYKVRQLINITDVGHLVSDGDEGEDKMTKALRREGKQLTLRSMKELALFYEEKFKEDLLSMGIDTSRIIFPRASETIPQQIALIQELEIRGFTYEISDGIYFNVKKFPRYGRLGQSGTHIADSANNAEEKNAVIELNKTNKETTHSRIGANAEKKDPRDFALWKFNPDLGWQSPWGKGFPGWHIECSAMAMSQLGATIDIHTGGIDHISVHHNNEIAQSEAATDKQFVHYWMHNEFVRMGSKISKSNGNFLRLKDILNKNISPLAYRYLLISASYRSPIDFSYEALDGAAAAYAKLIEHYAKLKKEAIISEAIQKTRTGEVTKGIIQREYLTEFGNAINDDLNTPTAIAVLWQLLADPAVNAQDKVTTVNEFDRVLGFDISNQANLYLQRQNKEQKQIPSEVRLLAEQREQSRRAKEWKLADELRAKIEKKGYMVKDIQDGFELKPIVAPK
jgi:cysteinyl-tRNA synthetase